MTPNIPIDSQTDQRLGASYAKALQATKSSTLQLRQAMLLDLLGADRSLWPALRHLIEQPGFEAVLDDPSQAARIARRDAWLQDLFTWCNQDILERSQCFLNGFLGLNSPPPHVSGTIPGVCQGDTRQPPRAAPKPQPAKASQGECAEDQDGQASHTGASGPSAATDTTSLFREGLRAIKNGNHRQAIQLFTQALQHDGSNVQLYLNRASAHAVLGELGAALADFNSVLRLQPNNAEALANRGKLNAMTGDTTAAIRDWSAAADQGHKQATSWLCTHLSEQGLESIRRGKHQQAIEFFSQALKREIPRKELFLNRACAHAGLGSLGAAIEDYNAVLRLDPSNAEALAQRGRARAAMGLTEEAKRDWRQAADRGHPDAEAWLHKQLQKEQQEVQQRKASQEPNRQTTTKSHDRNNSSQNPWQAANPTSRRHRHPPGHQSSPSQASSGEPNKQEQARRLRDQALACRDRGDPQRAIDLLGQALQLDSSDAESYRLRALLLSRAGDLQQALQDLTAVLRLNPGDGEALALRGKIHEGLGHLELARQDWQAAVARGNRDATAWLANDCIKRAITKDNDDDCAQVIALCQQAIDLGVTSAQVHLLRGKAYLGLREFKRAISDLSQAIALQPCNAEALALRGNAYHTLGRHAEATADWQQARGLGYKDVPIATKTANRIMQALGIAVGICVLLAFAWLIHEVALWMGLPRWLARAVAYAIIGAFSIIANIKELPR